MWYNIEYINLCIMGVAGEERENGEEKIFGEIIAKNSPN